MVSQSNHELGTNGWRIGLDFHAIVGRFEFFFILAA